jgi:predicted phage tail protein
MMVGIAGSAMVVSLIVRSPRMIVSTLFSGLFSSSIEAWGVDTMFIGIEMMFVCNDTVRRHGSCPRKRDNTLFVTWQW